MCFLQLAPDPATFKPGQVVDKQLASQMVTLVLYADRQKALEVHFKPLAFLVECLDASKLMSCDRLIKTGYRQTTLFGFYFFT